MTMSYYLTFHHPRHTPVYKMQPLRSVLEASVDSHIYKLSIVRIY